MVYQKYGLPIWKLSTVALSLESVHSFGGKITRTEINGTPYITGMRCLVFTITFQTTLYKKPFHSNWGSNEIRLKGTSGPWKSLGSTLIPNLWPGRLMIALLMRDLECPSAPRKIVYNTGMCWHRFATAMSPSVLPLSTPPTSAPLFSPETDLWSFKGFKNGKV